MWSTELIWPAGSTLFSISGLKTRPIFLLFFTTSFKNIWEQGYGWFDFIVAISVLLFYCSLCIKKTHLLWLWWCTELIGNNHPRAAPSRSTSTTVRVLKTDFSTQQNPTCLPFCSACWWAAQAQLPFHSTGQEHPRPLSSLTRCCGSLTGSIYRHHSFMGPFQQPG